MSRHSMRAFFESDVDSDGAVVFNLLSHLYAAMLLTFSFAQIRRFWESLPLERNGVQLTGLPKYQLVLKEPLKVPLQYQLQMLSAVEPFCAREGISFDDLQKNFFQAVYPWRHLSAKALLGLVEPLIDSLFSAEDRRAYIYRHYEQLQIQFYPHSTHELVAEKTVGSTIHSTYLFSLDNSTDQLFDYQLWILPWLQNIPRVFGLDPSERAQVIADERGVEQILSHCRVEVKNGEYFCDGVRIGKAISFEDFAKQNGLPNENPFNLKVECCLCEKGYIDSSGRELLEAGCCYGAPAYLVQLQYKSEKKRKNSPLQLLLRGLFRDDDLSRARLNDLHEAYFAELSHTAKIVYHSQDDSISIDGEHFIRNVPARIFRKVIRAYLMEKRVEFENREFKRHTEITLDLINPNFEGRLNRLMARLQQQRPDLAIVRHKRGGFLFAPKCAIDYREE